MSNKVRFWLENETASGKRCGWTKRVTGIDPTKSNGYCFVGDFLKAGENELPIGSVLIQKIPEGSVAKPRDEGRVLIVIADNDPDCEPGDGKLETFADGYDWQREFLSFRDAVKMALAKQKSNIDKEMQATQDTLAIYSDAEIRAEAIRRGIMAGE